MMGPNDKVWAAEVIDLTKCRAVAEEFLPTLAVALFWCQSKVAELTGQCDPKKLEVVINRCILLVDNSGLALDLDDPQRSYTGHVPGFGQDIEWVYDGDPETDDHDC